MLVFPEEKQSKRIKIKTRIPENLFHGTDELYLCSWLGKSSLLSPHELGSGCRDCSSFGAVAPSTGGDHCSGFVKICEVMTVDFV